MATINWLVVPNILQSIFFCVQQKKLGFEITWGWVNHDRIYKVNYPFNEENAIYFLLYIYFYYLPF